MLSAFTAITFKIAVNVLNQRFVCVPLALSEPYQCAVNVWHWSVSHTYNHRQIQE